MSKMIADNVWFQPEPLLNFNTDFDDIRPSKAANSPMLYYSQFLAKRKGFIGDVFVGLSSLKGKKNIIIQLVNK